MPEAVAELEHTHEESEAPEISPCMEKLNRLDWLTQRSYRVGEYDLGIRTTSAAFDGWLDYALDAYRTDEETKPNYSVVIKGETDDVLTRRRPHTLYRVTANMLKTAHLRTVGRALMDDLGTLTYSTTDDDSLYAEVGAIEVDGKVVVIPLILWSVFNDQTRRVERLGARLSTSLIQRLDLRSPRILPLPQDRLRVPADALDRLSTLDPSANGHADRLIVDEPRAVDAVFVWGNITKPCLPVSRGYAARDLAYTTANLPILGGRALDAVGRFLEEMPCYALNVDTVPRTLETLVRAIEEL